MGTVDEKMIFVDNQEKEIAEEECLDTFILNHLCEDIMEEVLDGGLISDCLSSDVFQKPGSSSRKKKLKQQSK